VNRGRTSECEIFGRVKSPNRGGTHLGPGGDSIFGACVDQREGLLLALRICEIPSFSAGDGIGWGGRIREVNMRY